MTLEVQDSSERIEDSLLYKPREELLAQQDASIKAALDVAWNEIGFYRDLWTERGGSVDAPPESLDEWPLWNVSDLRTAMSKYPPFGNLYKEKSLEDVRFIHSSSGTTGKPRYTAFTAADESSVSGAYARIGSMTGLERDDIYCVTASYGLPIGAWSHTRMARVIGATVVAAGSGRITPSDKLIDIIHDTGVTAVEGTTSYLLYVARKALESGRRLDTSRVRMLSVGGESAPPAARAELKELWGADIASQLYANSDVSWIAGECRYSSDRGGVDGMHVLEDLVKVEILDENLQPCLDGEYGELVLTSLIRPSTPRIRFRTGDRAAIDTSPCPCGRSSVRILPLAGRTDDAVRFHGLTVWPSAVEDVLDQLTGRRREFIIERIPDPSGSALRLWVERIEDEPVSLDRTHLTRGLRERTGVTFQVHIAEPGATAEATGLGSRPKTRRFVDRTTEQG